VPLCAPSLPGTLSDCTFKKYCLPTNVFVLSIILGNLYLAFIQLLDVNEVVIIIIILGEPQYPDFIMIIASRLCELYKEN
jgi:hypothetical protein